MGTHECPSMLQVVRRRAAALVLTWLCAMLAGCEAVAEPYTISIREQLNQEYGPELVSYPFTAPKRQCVAESISIAGPAGPVAAQLADIQTWAGKAPFVKSARLYFVVDALKPLTAAPYTVTFGNRPAPAVATDLEISRRKDMVELTTGRVGVRLRVGESKPAAPIALADVPAPLAGMRLAGGPWAGGSKFTGDAKVAEWSAELTDNGPVFARVVSTYTFADGNTFSFSTVLIAGDSVVRWDMAVRDDRPDLAVEFRLPPVPGVKQALLPDGYGQWFVGDRKAAVKPGGEPFVLLSPESSLVGIFRDSPWAVRLTGADGVELGLNARQPGDWVEPSEQFTYGGFKSWDLEMIETSWEKWRRKRMPVSYAADGEVRVTATLASGGRKWSAGAGAPVVGDQLDWVKDMVLDWPASGKRPYPRLFLEKKDMEDVWARAKANGVEQLRGRLALLGDYDVMRGAIQVAARYDALIDSPMVSAEDRALFRAQMAYLGYLMADAKVWSAERGFHSGNPNMSCSYILSHGIIACALSDHPKAQDWADYATGWMERWLTEEVGPNGEWMCEGSHYGYVSLEPMLSYAITAKRAGYHDFTNDPRLKKLLLYFAKTQTPHDPQRGGFRVTGAWGRGTLSERLGIFGFAARMTAEADPAFSRTMQWVWAENGYPPFVGDSRLGGFETYHVDRRLPAEAPPWGSDRFPALGTFLRAAFNTPHESYLNLLACTDSMQNLDVWTPGIGGISQWYGRGKPLSTCFCVRLGYNDRHELLRDGVRLARNWGAPEDPKGPFGHYTTTHFGTFADLPQADYVRSRFVNTEPDDRDWFPSTPEPPAYPRVTPATEGTLDWTRQLLFVKDADPAGPAWLLLRDTTRGGQPTAWQFRTLSEVLDSADRARDPDALLAGRTKGVVLPARELPPGDRYTALGQHGVDVEFFVAAPADTPRHTLRYGGKAHRGVRQEQDLLLLQQPGDGAYYVAVFPRPRAEKAPTFAALADGKIIKAAGPAGIDFAFLASEDTTAAAEGISFRGTAGCVQRRAAGATLSLGAAGEVRWDDYALSGSVAASLRVTADKLLVDLPTENPGGEVIVSAPKGWKVANTSPGVKATVDGTAVRLAVPKGPGQVVLTPAK